MSASESEIDQDSPSKRKSIVAFVGGVVLSALFARYLQIRAEEQPRPVANISVKDESSDEGEPEY